ncbi:MAG: hypothetical protein QM778_15895 [Myxococcales bacterium]
MLFDALRKLGLELMHGRIEEFLLDGHVSSQVVGQLVQEGLVVFLLQLCEQLCEQLFDLAVLLLQELGGQHETLLVLAE